MCIYIEIIHIKVIWVVLNMQACMSKNGVVLLQHQHQSSLHCKYLHTSSEDELLDETVLTLPLDEDRLRFLPLSLRLFFLSELSESLPSASIASNSCSTTTFFFSLTPSLSQTKKSRIACRAKVTIWIGHDRCIRTKPHIYD